MNVSSIGQYGPAHHARVAPHLQKSKAAAPALKPTSGHGDSVSFSGGKGQPETQEQLDEAILQSLAQPDDENWQTFLRKIVLQEAPASAQTPSDSETMPKALNWLAEAGRYWPEKTERALERFYSQDTTFNALYWERYGTLATMTKRTPTQEKTFHGMGKYLTDMGLTGPEQRDRISELESQFALARLKRCIPSLADYLAKVHNGTLARIRANELVYNQFMSPDLVANDSILQEGITTPEFRQSWREVLQRQSPEALRAFAQELSKDVAALNRAFSATQPLDPTLWRDYERFKLNRFYQDL